MKHSDSTEMDRLLRRYARRNGEAMHAIGDSPGGSRDAAGAHMDADEMSAYAEGVLPEAARSRYVAHLADCDACRKLVTNLTLATGIALKESARISVADASPSKSWREWLAALFSPPVLRYGVPALALLAVIVVAFVATRPQRERQFTARNETVVNQTRGPGAANGNTSALTTTDTVAEGHSNSNAITLAEQPQAPSTSSATTAATPVKTLPADQDAPSAPQTSTSQTTDQAPGAASREQGEVLSRKDDATVTNKPASPPPPAATPAPKIEDGRDKQGAQKKAGSERDEEKRANQSSPGVAGATPAQNEIAEDRNTTSKSEGMSDRGNRAGRRVFGAATTTPAPNTATQKERAAETRQVAGRQFRRQGNSWVDTAYKSSRSLTNVARGSEQYRALVADEPGLRTVAEQLGGDVIVVWKSRAYRFH